MSAQEELIAKLIEVVGELTKEVDLMKTEIASFSAEFKEFREDKQKSLQIAEKKQKDLNDLETMCADFQTKVYDDYVVRLIDVPFQAGDKDNARTCWARLLMDYIEEEVGELDAQQKKEVQESGVFTKWRVRLADMHSDKKGIIHREAVVPFLVNKNIDTEVVQKVSEGDLAGHEKLIEELYNHIWGSITFLQRADKPEMSADSKGFVEKRAQTWAQDEKQQRKNEFNQQHPVEIDDDSESEGNPDSMTVDKEIYEEETLDFRNKVLGHKVHQESLPKNVVLPKPVLKKQNQQKRKISFKKKQKESPSAEKLQLAQTLRATKRYSEAQIIKMVQASDN